MRCYALPFKNTNPRSVRGAEKRGWHVIKPVNYREKSTWLGLNIWCENSASGYWVSSYHRHEFAFEKGADAVAFQMKWG